MGINRKHIGDTTIEDLIEEREQTEPGFRLLVDEQLRRLEIARKIKALRETRGLTQEELARQAGANQATIARIEGGRAVPKLDLLARIAAALGAELVLDLRAPRRSRA